MNESDERWESTINYTYESKQYDVSLSHYNNHILLIFNIILRILKTNNLKILVDSIIVAYDHIITASLCRCKRKMITKDAQMATNDKKVVRNSELDFDIW